MKTIAFEDEFPYSGNNATTLVELVHPRLVLRVEMVLDTGAAISVLNRMFIGQLGISVLDGAPMGLALANGDRAQAFVHPIEMVVFGRRRTIEAAICPEWDMTNLLGMRGFFDQVVVAFDHANRSVYV